MNERLKGVTYDPRENIYRARVRVKGRLIYVGSSKDPKVAHEFYLKAREQFPDGRMKKPTPNLKMVDENFIPELPKGV